MKILSSIVLLLCSVLGYSQTILYQQESTSRTVQDPQTVVLAQGFKATSSTSNPFVAKIGPGTENPGGGPTDSNAGATNPSGTIETTDNKFHSTAGNIEVSGAGQLQFSLPFTLPPGIKNVAPRVSLDYTSDSGNGIAGYGWSISGISSIVRTGKTIEKDDESKSVQVDYSDYYSFNGQRLILKSGEYGKDGAEYVTAKYSNVKIKSVGNSLNISGPNYWEVTFEDGSQATYEKTFSTGFMGDSTPTLEYNITKWKDAQGNYITYNYEATVPSRGIPGGVSRISTIQWGGNETLNKPHFNMMQFTYIDREVFEQSYVKGSAYIQNKLLSEIKVTSNGNQFKRYAIDYIKNGTNYQFVDKVTEYNTDNIAANPVKFTYPNFVSSQIDYTGVLPSNTDSFDNVKFTGDFNGDSYMDFVMNNGVVKLGAFNDAYQDVATGKTFNGESKVVNTLIDEEGQIHYGNGIVQYESGKIAGYIFKNNTFVKVFEKLISQTPCTTCSVSLNEGDINGDGISDIFLTIRPSGIGFVDKYIIDLKNSNNPLSTYSGGFGLDENSYTDQKYLDIDGDGKVDIINVSNTAFTVFEFVPTGPNQYLKKIKFTGNLSETKSPDFPTLFGDFNGDGNLDFTIPVTDNQNADNWRFYMGTENGFENTLVTNFLKFRKPNQDITWSLMDHHFYSISDINKDGKSDIVFVYSKNTVGGVSSSGNALWRSLQYEIKTMQANGGVNFVPGLNTTSPSYTVGGGEYGLFEPLTNPIKSNNNYYDIFVFKNTRVHKYKAQTSLAELARIKSINQANVITTVDYKELNTDVNPYFYAKTKKEYYPYFSLSRSDQSYAVSQLFQAGRKQDFRYRGMTGHLQGKGVIGYYQTARSSWYADGFENTKIWSGTEIDPLNDGVPAKEWSIRTNDESKIFPTDISENNTQLLSFKSTIYQSDNLLDGQVVTAAVANTNKSKIVLATIPKATKSKDFLTGNITTGSITYGDYYLPSQSVSSINNGYGAITSTFEYIHNLSGVGSNYYIGRPKSKTDVTQAYGDTKSVKEEYTYENNLLKTLKTWNRDNTGYLLETYDYDSFGNIIKRIINNSIDSQMQTAQSKYDTTGRFVEKKTDNLGIETNIIYDNWGQIKTQTDPLGNTLSNTYDAWGKLLNSKTNLGGVITYQYEKDNNSNIIVTQNEADNDVSKKYTNKFGQEYKTSTKVFGQGQYVSKEIQYDVLGRKTKESEPYFEGQNASEWNTIMYNDSIFPTKITATSFTGKQMETTVSGLITTVKELNGYGRITSKTMDALGNVVTTTDKGGTINFNYNAAGEQIRAVYDVNNVITKYDVWGRKSEFNDPSNGTYKYEYDGFGQPKKIVSPKGTKEYNYNNLGQLISQRELSTTDGGQATDKTITYSYDNKGKLISKTGTSKGKVYGSNLLYDIQGRLLSTSENSNGKYFIQKGITYDDKGRVTSYEKNLYSSGVMTKVNIENIYSSWNGELYQIKDKNSGKILWQLNATNEKGQILNAKLGEATIANSYINGFLIRTQHSSQVKPGILDIKYTFNTIKNELVDRTTLGDFNILEKFTYDDNNRLVSWTDPVTGANPLNRNVYDIKGRIVENDQVGKIKFDNATKIYQPTGMTLNAAGTQNYNNDLVQSIAYNENNDPVFIDGEKGDVAFQYGLTSMRQRVTYGGNFNIDGDGKFTKFYSQDGSYEVVKDNVTGKEKHIIYIGGTSYESNIIYLKNYDEANGSYKFLHKDYIGSILAITDEAGNKLEQRHFDAWGNFTHLQIGNGAVITDKNIINNTSLLLERGYTSHEHFTEVGIIHMNGRLYDPLLRRFLNADENIQDPTNTQNYNKYGYVMNNPLMFNDPSGEYWEAGFFLAWIAPIIWGAIVGAAIGATVYLFSAAITGNWSWSGFGKAILLGAVTGAVSGGLSQVFTATGFWGTVANGTLTGAGSGGAASLINGTNFLEGLAKGAVVGGIVGAVSWSVTKMVNAANVTKGNHEYKKTDSYSYNAEDSINPANGEKYSYGTVKKFEEAYGGLGNEGVKHYNLSAPEGYGVAQDGAFYKKTWWENLWNSNKTVAEGNYLGITTSQNDIYLSKAAFASKGVLTEVITHETGHVLLNNSSFLTLANTSTNFSKYADNEFLDNWGHVAIRKMSIELQKVNPWMKVQWIETAQKSSEFMRYINSSKSSLDGVLKKLIRPFKF